MAEILVRDDGAIEVRDGAEHLLYTPYDVVAPDGSHIAHESRGGDLVSARAVTVGETFVELSHLGDGPAGGELVMVVTPPDGPPQVALGALVAEELPETVTMSWASAVDLALGLIADGTLDSGSKDDVDAFHQRLLGVLLA